MDIFKVFFIINLLRSSLCFRMIHQFNNWTNSSFNLVYKDQNYSSVPETAIGACDLDDFFKDGLDKYYNYTTEQ